MKEEHQGLAYTAAAVETVLLECKLPGWVGTESGQQLEGIELEQVVDKAVADILV